jgi:hypothetical protein
VRDHEFEPRNRDVRDPSSRRRFANSDSKPQRSAPHPNASTRPPDLLGDDPAWFEVGRNFSVRDSAPLGARFEDSDTKPERGALQPNAAGHTPETMATVSDCTPPAAAQRTGAQLPGTAPPSPLSRRLRCPAYHDPTPRSGARSAAAPCWAACLPGARSGENYFCTPTRVQELKTGALGGPAAERPGQGLRVVP